MKSSHYKAAVPIAVFDISSSSVAGAHVLLHTEKDDSVILAQSRIDAPLHEDMSMDRYVKSAVKHLEQVITRVRRADHHHPSHVQLILASPWYASQTRAITYSKDMPFTCSEKLIDTLVHREVEYMLKHDMERFGTYGHEAVVVEKQISLIKLNGYSTSDPYGKKATTLELFLTLTIAPKIIVDQFTSIIHRGYGSTKVGITTSPYTTFISTRDNFSTSDESVIIDVGEEITDVAFVKGGLFLYQHSFPTGTYELYREVGSQGNMTADEARSLLEAYRLGKSSMSVKKVVTKAITNFSSTWQSQLQKVLDDGHFGLCLPDQCFIVADPRFEIIFTDIIKTDPYIQHTCSRGPINPVFLMPQLFEKKVRNMDLVAIDVPLAIATLFLERLM